MVKPILFNTEMVRAILAGRKTVTRRLIKPIPQNTECKHELQTFNDMLPEYAKGNYECACRKCGWGVQRDGTSIFKPPCIPGDILYVRETWCIGYDGEKYFYLADKRTNRAENRLLDYDDARWRPSIHMPKEAARIFLRVAGVHAEWLQDIDAAGIRAEGLGTMAAFVGDPIAREEFKLLWNSTCRKDKLSDYGWEANPWVWVIEFERCEKPEGF